MVSSNFSVEQKRRKYIDDRGLFFVVFSSLLIWWHLVHQASVLMDVFTFLSLTTSIIFEAPRSVHRHSSPRATRLRGIKTILEPARG